MIRDCNRFVSPSVRPIYNVRHIRHTIHITHLRMAVQFYPLLRISIFPAGCKIRNLTNAHYRTDSQLTVIFINSRHTFDFQECAFLNISQKIWKLFIPHKHLYHNGICKIRYCKDQYRLLITDFPGFETDHLSTDGNLTHFSNDRAEFKRRIIKITSKNHIRIIRLTIRKTATSAATTPFLTIAATTVITSFCKLLLLFCFFLFWLVDRRFFFLLGLLFFFLFLLCSLLMQCTIPLHNGIHFLLQSGFIELQLAILHFLIFYLNLHRNMKALFKDITYQWDDAFLFAMGNYRIL